MPWKKWEVLNPEGDFHPDEKILNMERMLTDD